MATENKTVAPDVAELTEVADEGDDTEHALQDDEDEQVPATPPLRPATSPAATPATLPPAATPRAATPPAATPPEDTSVRRQVPAKRKRHPSPIVASDDADDTEDEAKLVLGPPGSAQVVVKAQGKEWRRGTLLWLGLPNFFRRLLFAILSVIEDPEASKRTVAWVGRLSDLPAPTGTIADRKVHGIILNDKIVGVVISFFVVVAAVVACLDMLVVRTTLS